MAKMDCLLGWKFDPEVTGSHNLSPVYCGDYIVNLETAITELIGDDSLVKSIREKLGLSW